MASANKLMTWCRSIDSKLGGGLPTGNLVEFVGESGVGKTQVCLQTLLTIQLPPDLGELEGRSLYVHTQGNFPTKRLSQMASYLDSLMGGFENPFDLITVKKINSVEEIRGTLAHTEQLLNNEKERPCPYRLIVFDSIASLCRGEYGNTPIELSARNNFIQFFCSKMRLYATRYDLVVLLVNEVSDVVFPFSNGIPTYFTNGRRITPCLGSVWGNHLNVRLLLSKEQLEDGSVVRFVRVFGDSSTSEAVFSITKDGVK